MRLDVGTILVILIAVLAATLLSAWIMSSVMSSKMEELYSVIKTQTTPSIPKKEPPQVQKTEKEKLIEEREKYKAQQVQVDEEELFKKLRKVIDQKVQNVLEEAKRKKERILMLLDIARGYTLGYVSMEEYNAFLMKVLSELEEFKRLWLARFPSVSDKEKLNSMITYIARTKLPIEVRTKNGKEVVRLPPEEALIKITSNINNAISILDDLIKSRGENPAITPLEVKLSNEVEKLKKKIEQLERQLEEFSMT
ncbi:hypothetical protein [Thermococcus sp.]